jgi:hypothetical protein
MGEFLAAYYGPAAAPVRKYLDLMNGQVAEHKDWHVNIWAGPDAKYLGPEVIAESVRLFDEAAAAVAADKVLTERVETARLPVLYVQIMKAKPGAAEAPEWVATFERIARRAGVNTISEDYGRGKIDTWLKAQRDRLKIEAPKAPEPPKK